MTTMRKSMDNQQVHDQEEQYNQDNDYNNIIITTQSRACSEKELPGKEIMEQIAEAYRYNICSTITQAAALVIERALKNGMEPKDVILAINETGMAPRPSPYYLQAILRNWTESGVVFSKLHGRMVGKTQARPWWRG